MKNLSNFNNYHNINEGSGQRTTSIGSFKLDQSVKIIFDNGDEKIGFISSVQIFSKRLNTKDVLSVSIVDDDNEVIETISDISYDSTDGVFFTTDGEEIVIRDNRSM